jgi:hypothetical protein
VATAGRNPKDYSEQGDSTGDLVNGNQVEAGNEIFRAKPVDPGKEK